MSTQNPLSGSAWEGANGIIYEMDHIDLPDDDPSVTRLWPPLPWRRRLLCALGLHYWLTGWHRFEERTFGEPIHYCDFCPRARHIGDDGQFAYFDWEPAAALPLYEE